MKILKIRFENIHSLKGEHEIDFSEGILAEAGLFAIVGPTGSGKSTLLDVITLALYDNIARMGKLSSATVEDDGGIMTRNMRSCYAEVEYRVNGKDYRSHWSIERNRNNNLNQRKLEVAQLPGGEILASGINETPKKNSEIIGLSYQQFVKAIVLSQGEFSKLLQAPRNERNKLLEDITGAGSYREIGRAVYFRWKGIEKDISLKEATLKGMELLSPEETREKGENLKALQKAKPALEKEYQELSDKIKARKELQQKEGELKELMLEKKQYEDNLKIFKPFQEQLRQHEKFSKYRENLIAFDAVSKEYDSHCASKKEIHTALETAKYKQNSSLTSIEEILREKVEVQNAAEKLEAFRRKIEKLQTAENNKRSEAQLHKKHFDAIVKKINLLGYQLQGANTPSEAKTQVEKWEDSLLQTTDQAHVNSLEEIEKALEDHFLLRVKAEEFMLKQESYILARTNLNKLIEKELQLKESVKKDAEAGKIIEGELLTLSQELQQLEKEFEQQRRHQSLEEHRARLKPNEPCPLCGSVHHPYATAEIHFNVQEKYLTEKQNLLATKEKLRISLQEKNKLHFQEIERIQTELSGSNATLEGQKEHLQKLAQVLKINMEASAAQVREHQNKIVWKIKELEKVKRAFQAKQILLELHESLTSWQEASSAFTKIYEERKALYAGNDIQEQAQNIGTALTRSLAQVENLKAQLAQTEKKIQNSLKDKEDAEKELEAIVKREQLSHLLQLRNSIMAEERANKIRKREGELNEQKTRLSEKEISLSKTISALKEKDDSEKSLENLNMMFVEAKKKWDELLQNIGRISQSLQRDKEMRENQQKLLNELLLLQKDLDLWKTMNDLVGDATGNKFSNFVQDLTLEQLIGFANKRLEEFSDRYTIDIPTAEEAEKSDTLKVFDSYMGNSRRSIKTLSGGETFLVSLAMAFALSDIAAKNVKIESLFIDEGFGTLDPETLEQAINILEKMQSEGDRSVGVISHVSALKERITAQIQLEKGSLGYSTINISH